ncbi:hypothetical protein [uncultured Mediterranean phage uvDeep-CGR2-KM18-C74]|nr:hypothetical protein [uncultured Mediterranean phage uvDeep-CGR2-KM18-C74]
MAKQSGLGDYIAVDDSGGTVRDISDNITSVEFGNTQNLLDSTTISKSAMERLIGLGDVSWSLSGVFDAASNKSHDVFKTKSGTRTVTYSIGGNTSGNPTVSTECLVGEYNVSRGTDGAATWSVTMALQSGTVATWGTV